MTSPELQNIVDTGHKTSAKKTARVPGESVEQADDVSFAHPDQTSDKTEQASNVSKRGIANAQDVMSQLQTKASEFTSNLLDRANIDDLTKRVEAQVREHPARALLMMAGAGFLLGRAARR